LMMFLKLPGLFELLAKDRGVCQRISQSPYPIVGYRAFGQAWSRCAVHPDAALPFLFLFL